MNLETKQKLNQYFWGIR